MRRCQRTALTTDHASIVCNSRPAFTGPTATGDDAIREDGIAHLARGQWQLDRWVWRENTVISWFGLALALAAVYAAMLMKRLKR